MFKTTNTANSKKTKLNEEIKRSNNPYRNDKYQSPEVDALIKKILNKNLAQVSDFEKRLNKTYSLLSKKEIKKEKPVVGLVTVTAAIIALAALGVVSGVSRLDVRVPAAAVAVLASITAAVSVTRTRANNVKIRNQNPEIKEYNKSIDEKNKKLKNQKENEINKNHPLKDYANTIRNLTKLERTELAEKITYITGKHLFVLKTVNNGLFPEKFGTETIDYKRVLRSLRTI